MTSRVASQDMNEADSLRGIGLFVFPDSPIPLAKNPLPKKKST
jgi:hypothetical protein